jgi:hypothetical protein
MVEGHHSGNHGIQHGLHGFASDRVDFDPPSQMKSRKHPADFAFIVMKHELHHLGKSREFCDSKTVDVHRQHLENNIHRGTPPFE